MNKKWLLLALLCLIVALAAHFQVTALLDFENLKSHHEELKSFATRNPMAAVSTFMFVYIGSTALSIPGATALTLLGGGIFGFGLGLVVVSFSSAIGATLAFLVSRYLLRDWVQTRYGDQIQSLNRGIENDGWLHLLTLRLIPLFPFFLVNLLMGLTPIRLSTFYVVSQLGMLPATAAYVNAGTQLAKLESISDAVSPRLFWAFALLGLVPLVSQRLLNLHKRQRLLHGFSRPRRVDYNLIVIGAGAAGLVSTYIATTIRAKVLLIEKNQMGGDCLNTGCVPSKALLKSARLAHLFRRHAEFGFHSASFELHFKDVMARVRRVIRSIEPHDSVERYTGLGADCIKGEARLLSPYQVAVDLADGSRQVFTSRAIILATGARPIKPVIPGLEMAQTFTSETVWEMAERPERLVVLGGGPIGCELAQAFSRLGSKVTLVEKSDRLLQREDQDVSQEIAKRFQHEGIQLRLQTQVSRVLSANTLQLQHSTGEETLEFDAILFALGRKPELSVPGASDLGISLSQSGGIECDEYLATRLPNIYACGDLAGPYQFTHVAAHQAWFATVNALLGGWWRFKVDYRVIPWCTFIDPEVARVGLNESEARRENLAFEVNTYGIDDLDRAIADGEAHGFVKVLTRPGSDKILGATIVGHGAGEMIAEFVLAMKHGIGLNQILNTIHIYPTFAEANKYVAGTWKKKHKPDQLLSWLAKFHAWRRR